jgi:outer membrane protein assembly factor BamB
VLEGAGVAWKTKIPGLGHSSPVVLGDAIFVTTAITGKDEAELKVGLYGDIAPVEDDTAHSFRLLRLDRKTGKIVWERTAHDGVPKVKRHTKSSHANPTPATDGKHVVAFFGSEGLYAYDMTGKLLWNKDLGLLDSGYYVVPDAQWAFASSPVIHDGRVIVQCDVQKGSFLAAFDVKTGAELWRVAREDVPSWSTPTVHAKGDRVQILVNGYRHMGGYDLATGKELWRMSGGGDIPVPTPYVAHDLVFLTSAHGGPSPIFAIRTSAAGDITLGEGATSNAHVAWSAGRGGSYIPTTLVLGDELYVLKDNGVLSAHDAKTGALHYQERLGSGSDGFTASLVAAGDKVYATSEQGEVYVVRGGKKFEVVAKNEVGEIVMATPAVAGGTIWFRGRDHLVAVREEPAKAKEKP